jgi:hypothetical protein
MRLPAAVGLALVLMFTASSSGMHMMPETVPVTRLLEIGEAAVAKNPESAEANYMLARIHYLAFACGTTNLEAYTHKESKPLPEVGPFQRFTQANEKEQWEEAKRRGLEEMKLKEAPRYDTGPGKQYWDSVTRIKKALETAGWRPKDLPDAEAAKHVDEAVIYFEQAILLAPKNALYRLGYASLLEQAHAWAGRHPEAASPFVKGLDGAAIRDEYRKAWEIELGADLKDKGRGMFGLNDMVSYEAGSAYVRLADAEKPNLSGEEAKTLVKVRASLGDLAEGRSMAVTPIIFGLRPTASIAELLAKDLVVEFPLRGWGPVGRWPWVKPETALLVWNPSRSGRIASGAQLFGSYTWELFWKTGYDALAVLDVNGDGELSGAELEGLAAWRDRNGNGISDPGEVQPLEELGVTGISTFAAGAEGVHPTNPTGVRFSDGRKLPTWDWVVTPQPQATRSPLMTPREPAAP